MIFFHMFFFIWIAKLRFPLTIHLIFDDSNQLHRNIPDSSEKINKKIRLILKKYNPFFKASFQLKILKEM